MCEHNEEMRQAWAGWVPDSRVAFCGNVDPHSPHGGCLGIMCDYGCNAEDF